MIAVWLVLPGLACGTDGPTRVIDDIDDQEPRDTSAVQNVSRARLYELVDRLTAGAHGEVHSLLVQRNGEVVIEEYFRGQAANTLHSMQSVSKSFTSALIGIAIENGDIDGVDERVLDFFPQWEGEFGADALKSSMQLQDVLTMRTGNDYHENGASAPHWQLNALPTGWDYFWLSRPMMRPPGTFFQYDSGGVIALSSMLKERTGMHADAYADQWLFAPLGISARSWFKNLEGHPHTGGGLSLTTRDMVKLGQLYLQNGEWEGQQVVPESWVDASRTRQVDLNVPVNDPRRLRWYGYLWWVLSPDPDGAGVEDIYAAIGAGGQFVFVIPEHEMVVGVTSSVQNGDQWAPITWLYSDVLTAIIR